MDDELPHRAYPKIQTSIADSQLAGTWVALEKVHGANFVIGVQADKVRFGKRKAWLQGAEPFFGYQLLRAELSTAARTLARRLARPGTTLYLYGEIFGGAYPHKDVPARPGITPVQTGIYYSPELRYVLFDVAVYGSDGGGIFVAHTQLMELAKDAGLLTPPLLARGPRSQVLATSERFVSRLPAALGLPSLATNWAEGIVCKPDLQIECECRPVIKRKIKEFDEKGFDESMAFAPDAQLPLDALLGWAQSMVNTARIASARSKWGEVSAAALIDEIVLDVSIDLEDVFPAAVRALDETGQRTLHQAIAARAGALLALGDFSYASL